MTSLPDPADLRLLAEARTTERQSAIPATADRETLTRLVHELQVHQIELEIQNDSLRQTQAALEASHDQYVDLYEFAPLGYVTVDSCGRIVRINLTGATLLGVARSELLNKHLSSFVLPGEADLWHQRFMQCLLDGERNSLELTLRRGDGSVFAAQLDCVRENVAIDELPHGASSAAPCLRIALNDISQRKAMEHQQLLGRESLKAAMDEAERANNAKSRFLAAASHDLRQPLAALKLYSGALKAHVTPDGAPLLANMGNCIASLSELLGDLLDLSKLDAGVVVPNVRSFALAEVLEPLLSEHRAEALLKGLPLRCRPTSWVVHTDPVLLRRILSNFISNALRYTEHGGVLVSCRRHDGKAWLEVWDTGIGIPAEQTTEIFEEFKQLGDDARTRGSGLGLAIAARTALLLGLEIRVRSRLGRGSLFAVELPLGTLQAVPQMPVTHAALYRPLRVALVEDNKSVRDALTLSLQEAGHQVTAAATRDELLETLPEVPPDILVSDYRLANGVTGFDVIEGVRLQWSELPALLLTGDTAPHLVREMAERGVVVLHKPVDLETLLAYLEDMTCPDSFTGSEVSGCI